MGGRGEGGSLHVVWAGVGDGADVIGRFGAFCGVASGLPGADVGG